MCDRPNEGWIAAIRKSLLFDYQIFTGSSSNKNTIRLLPALNVGKEEIDIFIDAFKKARTINNVPYNNWLLFSATVEAFFVKFDKNADFLRIEYALNKHMEWYVGDGLYSDGKYYHWDYYNSFVIHPMLIDVVNVLQETNFLKKL